MAQSLGQVHGPAVTVVEQHGRPLPERGRPDPDVDDDVEDRALHARHVLRLARRDVGEVDTAEDPLG